MAERGTIPRKIKGFRDIDPQTNALRWKLIRAAAAVYRRYGFEHWDTPALEYAECLGKHLPDADTPEEGVYSFRNPEREPVLDTRGRDLRDAQNNVLMENHFLALRYDLTAPLARRYAEHLQAQRKQGIYQKGAKPPLYRRFQYGPVYRFEAKLDPGRFREFWQLDFDTVGVEDTDCDAEACCVLCDALEGIGLARGTFELRVNNRKLHAGLFEGLGVDDPGLAGDIVRVVDKGDKIGLDGVAAELGSGWKDPASGAFIDGLGLETGVIDGVVAYVSSCEGLQTRSEVLGQLDRLVGDTPSGRAGLDELSEMDAMLSALGYGEERVVFDPAVARGLAYYTGPVFEAVSKLEVRDEKGKVRRFGSIAGGGRYDGLVERLLGVRVPATGASIGVDRLVDLLSRLSEGAAALGPVLVTVMDRSQHVEYQRIASELRAAGIETELFYGMQKKMKAQMSYADAKGCPITIIAGGNEFANGTVSVKNLRLGRALAATITDRDEWRNAQPAQVEVPRAKLAETVRAMLEEPIPA